MCRSGQSDALSSSKGVKRYPTDESPSLTAVRKAIVGALETHLDRIKGELKVLEDGNVRHATQEGGGRWIDKTEEAIHDKRNLLATLEALLRAISPDIRAARGEPSISPHRK